MHLMHRARLRIHIDSVMLLNEILCGTYMFKEIPVKGTVLDLKRFFFTYSFFALKEFSMS